MAIDIEQELERLLHADQHDPFQVLGLHLIDCEPPAAIIRAFQPHAESMRILVDGERRHMYKMRAEGLFEIIIPDRSQPFSYQLEATYYNNGTHIFVDPYCFMPLLGDMDRYLFNSGTHYEAYNRMGAHLVTVGGISGTVFRVWAPAARRVSVVGNFNAWDGRVHQMRVLGNSGIWELFIPGFGENEIYKFEIRTQHGHLLEKADPFQFYGELRPRTASVVRDLHRYQWQDGEWLQSRARVLPYNRPLSIYEVHPGSWRRDPADPERFLTYKELADSLVPYVKEMGFTHIELMPVNEHPLDESWGYQVTGYYSVTSRYGTPDEFMYFVDLCHQHGIGVILDWVPAHFPTDGHSIGNFDGTALYEHEDPRQGAHPEWGTLIFNYGRKETSNFLIANALFWFDKYHIDGLRVDAVASMLYLDYSRRDGEWMPNCYGGRENIEAIEFLKHLNSVVYEKFPNVLMIAEESTSFFGVSKPADIGGLGFGFKWNMGWMNDTLTYFSKDPLFRKFHHNALTFSLYYAFSENFILPLSHDEVVHGKGSLLGKMPGDPWQQFANLRLLFFFLWTHPGKKLLFMGGEFGQWSEWYCKTSLEWHLPEQNPGHRHLQELVKELNRLYRANPSLWEIDFTHEGFQWMDFKDADNSVIAFARFAKNRRDHLICLLNFTPQVHHGYRLGVPTAAPYREIMNTDSRLFGGTDTGNPLLEIPHHESWGEAPYHITVSVPPLGGIILQPVYAPES
ncbi:MAG: 1,4-alpha-glucan branching enzyme [Deltaproteobacteria bacterium RIFOXYD12_FULL_57_12]|nr:MAG: 1,4-alpha-glucan branching enzyme [Deltaproteobacteria bacterium RIFOXYD12_FULL_57_12]